eukprot:CAMPEP_0196779332 /NCGR_PEP_ID=MMETSP1104-20130614/6326_1 /TAXON_ID=33652 /ORGANISM="Cafeteria sp., Strain Caron Lab Isolate" /LENGTH=571 /DNA_ID=CAMNT_0042149511 /DNA_START=82 /DNA_END=1797 /DNA_ORIENTATION=+
MGNSISRLLDSHLPWLLTLAVLYHSRQQATRASSLPSLLDLVLRRTGSSPAVNALARNAIGAYVMWKLWQWSKSVRMLYRLDKLELKNSLGGFAFRWLRLLPSVSSKLATEKVKLERELDESLKSQLKERRIQRLPEEGMADEELEAMMTTMSRREEPKWRSGRVSGGVYHGEDDHVRMLNKAAELFAVSNPLHPDVWPSVMKFEAEVVAMTASMLNGGDDRVCGLLTSGGTESIFLSCKAHRKQAREERGITEPEIIVPRTAHAAFDKACDVLSIRLIKVDVDPRTCMVDVAAVRRRITKDTIMIVGSAPQFPHGIIDPIRQLSDIARSNGVGLHVDCCLGGFVLPFARELGYDIPEFDFGLPGVTAISVDTHKYGYAAKGTSVVLFRDKALRHHSYFTYANWPGGLYVTAGMGGSRPGALSAACWASMVRLGRKGYLDATRQIMETTQEVRRGVEAIPGLRVMGDPKAMIVSFTSDRASPYHISDRMAKRGWSLNALQMPPCIHICITVRHFGRAHEFLDELRAVVEELEKEPAPPSGGTAPVYGMASSLPAGPIEEMLATYVDVVYTA